MVFKNKRFCYVSNNRCKNKWVYVSFAIIFIHLERNAVLANILNSIHSVEHNVFGTREKRQVLFGGKYLLMTC